MIISLFNSSTVNVYKLTIILVPVQYKWIFRDYYVLDVLPCSLVHKHFRGSCCLDFQVKRWRQWVLLKLPVYQPAWHHTPKHGNFNVLHHEMLPCMSEGILHTPWQYFAENSCRASSTSIELRSVSNEGTKFWSVWVNRRALCLSTSIYSSPTLNTKCCKANI